MGRYKQFITFLGRYVSNMRLWTILKGTYLFFQNDEDPIYRRILGFFASVVLNEVCLLYVLVCVLLVCDLPPPPKKRIA